MLSRRSMLLGLAGLNVLLVVALLAGALSSPSAFAQSPGGRPGDFICVTAKTAGQTYDAVFLLDVPARKLHAMYPANVQQKQLSYAQFRDLDKDFRKK